MIKKMCSENIEDDGFFYSRERWSDGSAKWYNNDGGLICQKLSLLLEAKYESDILMIREN